MKEIIKQPFIPLALIAIILLPLAPTEGKSRKDEPIHASVKVLVNYGAAKNKESYRRDILNVIENYLIRSECFDRVVTDNQEATDLILEATIEELSVKKEYGASLGEIASEYSNPEAREKFTITYKVRMQLAMKRTGMAGVPFVARLDVDESRKRMYAAEDTEKYAWDAVLSAVEREAEKQICGKRARISKALSSP